MEYQICYAQADCPPALRVLMMGDWKNAPVQQTLLRQAGEAEHVFAARAQQAAHKMWLRYGMQQTVVIECVYNLPDAPPEGWAEYDERINALRALRLVAHGNHDDVDARIAAIKAINRMQGLVPAGTPW